MTFDLTDEQRTFLFDILSEYQNDRVEMIDRWRLAMPMLPAETVARRLAEKDLAQHKRLLAKIKDLRQDCGDKDA